MLRYWLDTYARQNVRPKTLESYVHVIERHIIPTLGAIVVQKLTADQVQAFYAGRLAAGVGPRTVQLCHLRLVQAIKQAVRLDLVARNVMEAVTPPRVERKEMEVWTADEARRFMTTAASSAYGPIWTVFLSTGMRRGEVLGLRWQDVDTDAGTLAVRQVVGVVGGAIVISPPKTKTSRRNVAVPAPVISALREHRAVQNERRLRLGPLWEDHDLVFAAANGKPINPENLKRDYDRWVAAAGVPRIRIHDLRHSHVTLAIKAGGSIKAVSQRVGHARTSITMDVGVHVLPEQHADVSDKIGAALFGKAL